MPEHWGVDNCPKPSTGIGRRDPIGSDVLKIASSRLTILPRPASYPNVIERARKEDSLGLVQSTMKRIARSYSHREQMRERCLQTLALIQNSKLQLMQSDGLIEWCGKFGPSVPGTEGPANGSNHVHGPEDLNQLPPNNRPGATWPAHFAKSGRGGQARTGESSWLSKTALLFPGRQSPQILVAGVVTTRPCPAATSNP